MAPDGADIRPRTASQIHTCHLFMLQFCLFHHYGDAGRQICGAKPDSAKLVSPRSSTDEKVEGPVKNMGGPIKLLYITMFKIGKSCKKMNFGLVKHEKFSRCLAKLQKYCSG